MSSNFDGKTYLIAAASMLLKNLSVGDVMSFDVVNSVCALYGDKELDIPYGSIKYESGKKKGDVIEFEYISFCPGDFDNIMISNIEAGNRYNLYSEVTEPGYKLLVSGRFNEGNNSIRTLININPDNPRAAATIVLNDQGSLYRGIYCISLNEKTEAGKEVIVEYFGSSVLDVIESTKDVLYSKDELTSFSSRRLKRVGFIPDKVATYDYDKLVKPYGKMNNLIGKTFANGSIDDFKKWINKIFVEDKEKEEETEKSGPVLGKTIGE